MHPSCLDLRQGHASSAGGVDDSKVALKMDFEGRAQRALAMPQADSLIFRVEADDVAGAVAGTSNPASNTAWVVTYGGN